MSNPFEIELVEVYYGVPILEVRCNEPTLLDRESDARLARALLEQPHERFAVIVDYRNISHATSYGPEQEAEAHQKEPFLEFGERVVAYVRFQAMSMTSLIHMMRANMALRRSNSFNVSPNYESAVRSVRRIIDRLEVKST